MEDLNANQTKPISRVPYAAVALVVALTLDLLARGVLPAFQQNGGDFANYYTASRVLLEERPLEEAYLDFTWFQKRMDEAGFKKQLGGFVPHPPPAAVLFVPLAGLDPLSAKRVWTILNLGFVLLSILLLSRISGLSPWLAAAIVLLTGHGLRNNFLFGQLYLLLLLSILGALYFHQRGRPLVAGLLLGSLIPIKYAGLPWGAYFAWKRRWSAAVAAATAALVLTGLTLWWVGWEPFEVFFAQVLPRHLAGEIQDPFASRLQSWTSLFRRLLLREATLNPNPPLDAPELFFFCKSLATCSLVGLSTLVLARTRFPSRRHSELFQWGWIGLSLMLVSPGGATYHFLLLAPPTAFFISILIDEGRRATAGLIALLFAVLNLPHYLWLEGFATGWTTPLGYSRLFFLALYYACILVVFRDRIALKPPRPLWIGVLLVAGGLMFWRDVRSHEPADVDGAHRLEIGGGELAERGGLIQTDPDFGAGRLVFCSMTRNPDGYAVFDGNGRLTSPLGEGNFYRPDLAGDDEQMLLEGLDKGSPTIWYQSQTGAVLQPIVKGESPKWAPDRRNFLFERDGLVHIGGMDGRERVLRIDGRAKDPTFLDDGRRVAYCVSGGEQTLRTLDLSTGLETILLSSPDRISAPSPLPGGKGLLFSWNRHGNRDVWAILTPSLELVRVTTHMADDGHAVWDPGRRRIVFTSDRGRGFGYTALYWLAPPPRLRDQVSAPASPSSLEIASVRANTIKIAR